MRNAKLPQTNTKGKEKKDRYGPSTPCSSTTAAWRTRPPSNQNFAYPDGEAIMASANKIGFGMESVSITDTNPTPGQVPTSSEDWVYNFATYPAPVHYLQTYEPGGAVVLNGPEFFAAGFLISSISVVPGSPGTATITCSTMCNPYVGVPIYIAGNSDPTLNGIWTANSTCVSCTAYQVQFPAPSSSVGVNNGTVWSPNYWPIVMPFVVRHGASAIEVYECDLDYAFGLGPQRTGSPDDQLGYE